MLHVKSAKYLSGFKLWVAFDDGTAGEVDLDGVLKGPVFDPLQDVNMFKRFAVDPELETLFGITVQTSPLNSSRRIAGIFRATA